MIKILLISVDHNLKSFMEKNYSLPEFQLITFNSSKDPLDLISQVFSVNPSVLMMDDDFLLDMSDHLLRSIKNANPKLSVIFITSNTSLELGRKINSIGVKHYLMKPITENEMQQYLNSIIKEKIKLTY